MIKRQRDQIGDTAKRSRASLQAGVLVEKALNAGMSLSEISEKTGAGLSTVQRWRSTGKGEAALVRKLERIIGAAEVGPEDLARYLAEEYTKDGTRKAFAVFDTDLYRVVGPFLDANGYLEDVRKNLRLMGYELFQIRKKGKIIHHIISFARISKITSKNIRDMKGRWREIVDDFSPDEIEEECE